MGSSSSETLSIVPKSSEKTGKETKIRESVTKHTYSRWVGAGQHRPRRARHGRNQRRPPASVESGRGAERVRTIESSNALARSSGFQKHSLPNRRLEPTEIFECDKNDCEYRCCLVGSRLPRQGPRRRHPRRRTHQRHGSFHTHQTKQSPWEKVSLFSLLVTGAPLREPPLFCFGNVKQSLSSLRESRIENLREPSLSNKTARA